MNVKTRYMQRKIQQYKDKKQQIVNSAAKLKGLEIRRKIRPFLRWILKVKSKVCRFTDLPATLNREIESIKEDVTRLKEQRYDAIQRR